VVSIRIGCLQNSGTNLEIEPLVKMRFSPLETFKLSQTLEKLVDSKKLTGLKSKSVLVPIEGI
jgi:hypothetical protein